MRVRQPAFDAARNRWPEERPLRAPVSNLRCAVSVALALVFSAYCVTVLAIRSNSDFDLTIRPDGSVSVSRPSSVTQLVLLPRRSDGCFTPIVVESHDVARNLSGYQGLRLRTPEMGRHYVLAEWTARGGTVTIKSARPCRRGEPPLAITEAIIEAGPREASLAELVMSVIRMLG